MGRTNQIKNPAFPLLVGLDHLDNSLVPKANEVIEQFGKKGKTLFIEAGTLREPSDPKYDPFDAAALKAAKKGMSVVILDRPRTINIKKKITLANQQVAPILAGLNENEFTYIMYHVRERQWMRTIRKQAKGGDIVMMHQLHLVRVLRELHPFGFGQNVWFVSKVTDVPKWTRLVHRPRSKTEVSELKGIRAARRPINIRRKK